MNFFKINSHFFCLVRKLEKIRNDQFINALSDMLKKYFFRFYNLVSLSDQFELVRFDKSINRVILIDYNNNFVVSSVIKSYEKD